MQEMDPKRDELLKRIAEAKEKSGLTPKKQEDSIGPEVPGARILIELIAGLLLGAFLGYHLDSYCDTMPLFLFLLSIFGVAGSLYNIYKEQIKSNNKE